jgi:imidazolonepropionase-like amidohydrolase
VEAGADTIEHGAFISDDKDLIDMMVRKGTFWVPTMIVYTDRGLLNPAHTWMPPFRREKAAEVNRNMEKNFRILHKAGVKIVMGTDTARNNVHGDNAGELEIYVKCGMTPMEAIVASTKMGAQALGYPWSEQLGTLEQGKEADLLVIDGDPLKDIAILQNKDKIRKVVKGGKVVIDREL